MRAKAKAGAVHENEHPFFALADRLLDHARAFGAAKASIELAFRRRFVDYLEVKHGMGAALHAILVSDGDQRMRTSTEPAVVTFTTTPAVWTASSRAPCTNGVASRTRYNVHPSPAHVRRSAGTPASTSRASAVAAWSNGVSGTATQPTASECNHAV